MIFSFSIIKTAKAAGALDKAIEDAPTIAQILNNILEFVLSVFGILAIISLVVAGIFYFLSTGDEERMKIGKRGATYAIVGIAVALSGMLILKTLAKFLS